MLRQLILNVKGKTKKIIRKMDKYKRGNNQLKYRHVLQMNYFKDSSQSFSRTVKLYLSRFEWLCLGDHLKWPSADNNLPECQTKFNDKNIWFEKQDPFARNGYFP